jgi:hypothetical protein
MIRTIGFTLFLLFLSINAYAQESMLMPVLPNQEKRNYDTEKIFSQLPADMQKEILDEGARVEQECRANYTISRMFTCECLAIRHIDERILSGPEMDYYEVANNRNDSECINEPGLASYVFDFCQNRLSHKVNANKVCTCAANNGAKDLASINLRDTKLFRQILSGSIIQCGGSILPDDISTFLSKP